MATAAAGDGGTQGIDQSVVESNHQQQQPTLLIPSVLELEAKNRQLKELLTDAQVELERYKNLTESKYLSNLLRNFSVNLDHSFEMHIFFIYRWTIGFNLHPTELFQLQTTN